MEAMIFYKTNTGHSKEYAELLGPRISCSEIYPLNKFNLKKIKDVKNIIFIGPIRNNVVQGLAKFLKKYDEFKDKNIYICAVGIKPNDAQNKESVIVANALNYYHVRLYILRGGFDISRFSKVKQFFIKLIVKIASKKYPELSMMISHPINLVSGYDLDPLVNVYYKVNS